MLIDDRLQYAMNELISAYDMKQIKENAEDIYKKYKFDAGQGKRLVQTNEEVIAYALSRMPATYAAVCMALQDMKERCDIPIQSITDFGAGTGAVSWAADTLFELESISCIEREKNMIAVGKQLMHYGEEALKRAKWMEENVTKIRETVTSDLVAASYIMNELTAKEKIQLLENLWTNASKIIFVIEPGTRMGAQNIQVARDFFLEHHANIIAPCMHAGSCNMMEDDWCHFSCRLSRQKMQKYLKNGDAPYEDEKFSYLIVTKNEVQEAKEGRIIRHPIVAKGYVSMKICDTQGIKECKITRKDYARYKIAKKAKWGDTITF